jgi:hypothetical protein
MAKAKPKPKAKSKPKPEAKPFSMLVLAQRPLLLAKHSPPVLLAHFVRTARSAGTSDTTTPE